MVGFLELLSLDFIRMAMVCGVLMAPLAGLLGTFVVLRGLSFFGEAIGHSTVAGVAVALFLGISGTRDTPLFLLTLVGFSLIAAILINWLEQRGALRTDTSIAVVYATLVALGNALISKVAETQSATTVVEVLFGSILFVGPRDLVAFALVLAAVAFFLWRYRAPLTLLTLQPDYAKALGVRAHSLNLAFLVLLTICVAICVRIMGAMLVTALLVIPAAAAKNVAGSLKAMLVWATVITLAAIEGGILVATAAELPTGASIVLVASAAFLATALLRRVTLAEGTA